MLVEKNVAIQALTSELSSLGEPRALNEEMSKLLDEKTLTIDALEADKLRLKQEVEAQNAMLEERAALLAERDSTLQDRATALEERARLLAARNADLQHSAIEAAEQERLLHSIAAEKQELHDLYHNLKQDTEQALERKDEDIKMLEALVLQHEEAQASIETVIQYKSAVS